ncbi:hypothetical protein Rhein_2200 [Rheinheimera sp. A13L]|uniref:hypothetical protein n=1 Tax=Rheinheimera sp. A13L TaxID=506534 RepID=UPI0002124A52|nr:hypothetical protein [Rheinheimera sp. A13L]EGM77640.1 hypothetical protein Rhein_2200 [Rheinheimera sp. A13L]
MYRFLFLIGLALASLDVFACSCIERSAEEYFKDAHKVLHGKIMKLEIVFDDKKRSYQKVTFDNNSMLKGSFSKTIYSALDGDACHGMSFLLGKEYVAFTDESNWITGFCGGTQVIWPNMEFSQDFLNTIKKQSPNK